MNPGSVTARQLLAGGGRLIGRTVPGLFLLTSTLVALLFISQNDPVQARQDTLIPLNESPAYRLGVTQSQNLNDDAKARLDRDNSPAFASAH